MATSIAVEEARLSSLEHLSGCREADLPAKQGGWLPHSDEEGVGTHMAVCWKGTAFQPSDTACLNCHYPDSQDILLYSSFQSRTRGFAVQLLIINHLDPEIWLSCNSNRALWYSTDSLTPKWCLWHQVQTQVKTMYFYNAEVGGTTKGQDTTTGTCLPIHWEGLQPICTKSGYPVKLSRLTSAKWRHPRYVQTGDCPEFVTYLPSLPSTAGVLHFSFELNQQKGYYCYQYTSDSWSHQTYSPKSFKAMN